MSTFQLNIDCEGPLTQNDNAFELCEAFIPEGGEFFKRISRYDDYLVEVEKKPNYKAGDTLKLILPFLKAYGISSHDMREFSKKTLCLIPGTQEFLKQLSNTIPSFIISTSYRPYLDALCELTGFPKDNVYATEVDIDLYDLPEEEQGILKDYIRKINSLKLIDWPEGSNSLSDLDDKSKEAVLLLDKIFWEELPNMESGRILKDVNPIGGHEKARAVEHSLTRTKNSLSQVIYIGDSITDSEALELVAKAGGVAIAFNANRYAIKRANWSITSGDTRIIGAIIELILNKGKEALFDLVGNHGHLAGDEFLSRLKDLNISLELLDPLKGLSSILAPTITSISSTNITQLIEHSEKVRKAVRGVAVGTLG